MSHQPQHNDKGAAMLGLVVTALVLFVLSFGIVKWTNGKFAGHEPGQAKATTSH